MNPKASLSVLILACGLLAAFFMPWIHIWFGSISGYELARLASSNGDHLPEGVIYIWIIPVLAVATIGLSFVTNNRPIGVVTGLVPLLASPT